ncbi:hypothetical protein [Streptomyces sp. NPDC090080]|uniref:DUF6841 family protein n=1 Tax=Streptomyces sp. NPDC090080 TaxID=3365939 RepID=UPI0037FF2C9E
MPPNPTFSGSSSKLRDAHAEITKWFFEDYLQHYIAAVDSTDDHSFIGDYWGAPLWVGTDAHPVILLPKREDVVAWFKTTFDRLQAAGYSHTAVLDRRMILFHEHGAAIDVIWSRQRENKSEIERLAVHFIIARGADGLRIVSIEAAATQESALDGVWPIHRIEKDDPFPS